MTPIEFCRWVEGYVDLFNNLDQRALTVKDFDGLLDAVVAKAQTVEVPDQLIGHRAVAAFKFYVWVLDCSASMDVHQKLKIKLNETIKELNISESAIIPSLWPSRVAKIATNSTNTQGIKIDDLCKPTKIDYKYRP